MKIDLYSLLTEAQISKLGFATDNPGGEWLEHQRKRTEEKGRKSEEYGVPFPENKRPFHSLGTVTGYMVNGTKVKIPVSKLKKLHGLNNEQNNVRKETLEWMKDHVEFVDGRTIITEPEYVERTKEEVEEFKASGEDGNPYWKPTGKTKKKEYPPFIVVDQDGQAWINEGNHRIMEAARRGVPYLYVEIRWYNGGEEVPGPFHPDELLTDEEAKSMIEI